MNTISRDRFWEKVDLFFGITDEDCWNWIGGKRSGKSKYGALFLSGSRHKRISSHRASWLINHGEIPSGLSVLHKCDNPVCVNPTHLFLGTQKDNVADMDSKNRRGDAAPLKGDSNPTAKISVQNAKFIKLSCLRGVPQSIIAREFGISQSMVSMINTGRRRGYLK